MRKLFVSIPMKDRTEEAIKASIDKMHKIAEVLEGEKLELLDTYITEMPPEDCTNKGIWYLSKIFKQLAYADVFIGITVEHLWRGCQVETDTASRYGIKCYQVNPRYVIDNYNDLVTTVHDTKLVEVLA